jgi:PIN domain nuclease of toxin-antitoxin system
MRYLIDTQILIWTLVNPEKLSFSITEILQNNEIFVGKISLFEIAIKQKIGKPPELDLSVTALSDRIQQDGFNVLPLRIRHIEAYSTIPLLPNHRDPFDRLLLESGTFRFRDDPLKMSIRR